MGMLSGEALGRLWGCFGEALEGIRYNFKCVGFGRLWEAWGMLWEALVMLWGGFGRLWQNLGMLWEALGWLSWLS